MSNVIDFLERMGQDSQLRHATSHAVKEALVGLPINAQVKTAILRKDQRQLENLLGAQANVCCIVAAEEDGNDVRAAHGHTSIALAVAS